MTKANLAQDLDPIAAFEEENKLRISGYKDDQEWQDLSKSWLKSSFEKMYMYHFKALGRPIIQTPMDIVGVQELIWEVKPDLVIEAGVAHGGSIIWNASIMAMLDYEDAVNNGEVLDPKNPKRRVIGIDIDIREHNRTAIETHAMASRIDLVEGSSIEQPTIDKVHELAAGFDKVMVFLDSMHTHDHVLAELEAYAPLTSKGSYCVVFDSIVEDLPKDFFKDRPWNPGNSPKTASIEYLNILKNAGRNGRDDGALNFEVDKDFEDKLMMTVATDGFLKRI